MSQMQEKKVDIKACDVFQAEVQTSNGFPLNNTDGAPDKNSCQVISDDLEDGEIEEECVASLSKKCMKRKSDVLSEGRVGKKACSQREFVEADQFLTNSSSGTNNEISENAVKSSENSLLHHSEQLSMSLVQLNKDSVQLSQQSFQLSKDSVHLSSDSAQFCQHSTDLRSECNSESQADLNERRAYNDLRADWQIDSFEIIDDISENNDEEMSTGDDSLDEDQIDAMLDEAMEHSNKSEVQDETESSSDPIEKEKVVLIEKAADPFDILPEGWVTVTHNSGMPVFLHKQARVCTLSKPYFLGPGSARKHDIPLSAVPCLHYRRACEQEEKALATNTTELPSAELNEGQAESSKEKLGELTGDSGVSGDPELTVEPGVTGESGVTGEPGVSGDPGVKMPSVEVKSIEEHKQRNCLNPLELREYCTKLFKFKSITVKRFKTWKDRRKHSSRQKEERPHLPSDTKLITCSLSATGGSDKVNANRKKAFVLNPAGKSDVCILHEYVQHAMRQQPRYIFKELDETAAPYSATVMIDKLEYGTGYASSKKAAKAEAAKITLGILIPEMHKVKSDENSLGEDVSFFNEVKIEDPRVTELCAKACQPSPYQVLTNCLKRNYGLGDTQLHMEMKIVKHQKSEFVMRVGKHEAKVICKNKRDGKQQAAQAILQKLHPHVQSWGSLLRLYGTKSLIEKKTEQNFATLPNESNVQKPNYKILSRLKQDMRKLHEQRTTMKANVLGRLECQSSDLSHFTDPASLNL